MFKGYLEIAAVLFIFLEKVAGLGFGTSLKSINGRWPNEIYLFSWKE